MAERVTIHWRPASDKGKHFEGGGSTELEVLKHCFGTIIRADETPTLIAMAIATKNSFYDEVAAIIKQVGAIEIWGEY